MTGMTQNQRILARLTRGALCGMEPLRWSPPITRVGARIYDLRRDGWIINAHSTCPEHQGRQQHAYYELVGHIKGDSQ